MGATEKGEYCRTWWPTALGLLVFSIPTLSAATELGYGLGYSAVHSNNMALSSTDPRADWLNVAKGKLAWQENNLRNFSARVYSQLEYDDYQHQVFSNQTLFTLNSAATWMIKPQSLSWTAEDYYGQVPIIPFATITPNNIQNVNVFTTGPNVLVHVDPLNTLAFGARYDNFHAGVANNNSNRVGGFVGWLYQYSPITVFSLNYHGEHTKYTQNVAVSGYSRQDLFLRMNTHLQDTAWIADLGGTWLNQRLNQTGRGNVNGVYARLLASHRLTERSTVDVTAMSAITDTEDAILSAEAVGGIASGTTVGTDIYRQDSVSATYTYSRGYSTDSVNLFDQKLKYYTAPLDQQQTGADVQLGYRLSGMLLGNIFGSYVRSRFYESSVINRIGQEGAGLTYEARPNIFLGLEGQVTRQRSNAAANSYSEKRIVLSISYYSNFAFVNAGNVVPSLMEQDNIARDIMYSR
ncbi:MAG: hypothetical protein ACYDHY_03285 [Acidiferrobacterales bacterium]